MIDHAEDLPTTLEICQIAFESLLEILGPEDLNSILLSSPMPVELDEENVNVLADLDRKNWAQLHRVLQAQFGIPGTAGIAIHTGQVIFKNFFRGFGSATLLDDREYRMMPKPVRIRKGLETLAELQEKYVSGSRVTIEHDQENWYWKLEPLNGWSEYPQIQDLLTKVVWGMVLEFLSWTGGGKIYPVHETAWADPGIKERVIVIRKKYVD
ncbi:MAG: hypothetical protein LLG42_11050 [Chloroflexi bacterium]|nr:hypothetical protein [Chloroflexota bacterium]